MAASKTTRRPKKPSAPARNTSSSTAAAAAPAALAAPLSALSPQSAEETFKLLQPRLDALPRAEAKQPNFNLQEGALVVLGADVLLRKPQTRAMIEALATAGAVDLALIDDLGAVARAAWYVRHRLSFAEALHSDASLPVKLVNEVMETRKRMLKTLAYQLEDDPEAQRMLTTIREGSGYLDAANDLLALADMYERHEAQIEGDSKNYRASDLRSARDLADKVLAAFGGPSTSEAQRWRNYQARVFTLLDRHHEEAIRVGRFLLHYEGGDELFPTMFSAVRSRPARKAPESEPAAPPAAPAADEKKPA